MSEENTNTKIITELRIFAARVEEKLEGIKEKNDSDHENIIKQIINHNSELTDTRNKLHEIEKKDVRQESINQKVCDNEEMLLDLQKKYKGLEKTDWKVKLVWKLLAPFGGAGAGAAVTLFIVYVLKIPVQ